MIACLLMIMVRDDCLLPLPLKNRKSSLTITINKQKIISYHYHQQTSNHLSPLPSTNKQSSLTITINKQTIISHHYHQQASNHLSPSTNKPSSLTITINRDDCLCVDANGER
jgi:hypothetical protein